MTSEACMAENKRWKDMTPPSVDYRACIECVRNVISFYLEALHTEIMQMKKKFVSLVPIFESYMTPSKSGTRLGIFIFKVF